MNKNINNLNSTVKKIFVISLFTAIYFLLIRENGFASIRDSTNLRHTETIAKSYKVRAVVKKIYREEEKIMLKHEKIKGVMPAMTMTFPVSTPSILDDLKAGDKRIFIIHIYKGFPTVAGVKSLPVRQRRTK